MDVESTHARPAQGLGRMPAENSDWMIDPIWVYINQDIIDDDNYVGVGVGQVLADVSLMLHSEQLAAPISEESVRRLGGGELRAVDGVVDYRVGGVLSMIGSAEALGSRFRGHLRAVMTVGDLRFQVVFPGGPIPADSKVALTVSFRLVRLFERPSTRSEATKSTFTVLDVIVVDRLLNGSACDWQIKLNPIARTDEISGTNRARGRDLE